MPNYTITAPGFAVHGNTLTANTEDVVTFPTHLENPPQVLIYPGGTTPVFFTIDGTSATVGGPNCYIVFPGNTATPAISPSVQYSRPTVVRLISTIGCTYSVSEG